MALHPRLLSMLAALARRLRLRPPPAPEPVVTPIDPDDVAAALKRRDELRRRAYPGKVIAVAKTQLGVRERGGSGNRGHGVDRYTRDLHVGEVGDDYCAKFAAWCHVQAAARVGGHTSLPFRWSRAAVKLFVAAVEQHYARLEAGHTPAWVQNGGLGGRGCFTASDVLRGDVEIQGGDIFVLVRGAADEADARARAARVWDRALPPDHRWTPGHAGLCVRRRGSTISTIEANVGGPGGQGVHARELSLTNPSLVGFIRAGLLPAE